MRNRIKTIEVTKTYVDAFNRRDLRAIEDMLDPNDVCFVRQAEPTLIGRRAIMNRTLKSFDRLDRRGHQMHMINAIIDIKDINAHPCMLGILDGERHSVVLLNCLPNGNITLISIMVTRDVIYKARPLEPLAPEVIAELHRMKPRLTENELNERRKDLTAKAARLKTRFKQEGATQELLGKWERLQEAQIKLREDENDFLYQH